MSTSTVLEDLLKRITQGNKGFDAKDVVDMALNANKDQILNQKKEQRIGDLIKGSQSPNLVINDVLKQYGGPAPGTYASTQYGGQGSGRPGPDNVPQHLQGLDPDLLAVMMPESGGITTADNPTSTAYGLGQLIQSNRETYGERFGFDPDTTDFNEQLQMMDAYIKDRYGSYAAARQFREKNGWY